jgi:hypothetical protein
MELLNRKAEVQFYSLLSSKTIYSLFLFGYTDLGHGKDNTSVDLHKGYPCSTRGDNSAF